MNGMSDRIGFIYRTPAMVVVPYDLLRDRELSYEARLLYAIVASSKSPGGDGTGLSRHAVADELGCSPDSVQGYVSELVDRGWLQAEGADQ